MTSYGRSCNVIAASVWKERVLLFNGTTSKDAVRGRIVFGIRR